MTDDFFILNTSENYNVSIRARCKCPIHGSGQTPFSVFFTEENETTKVVRCLRCVREAFESAFPPIEMER